MPPTPLRLLPKNTLKAWITGQPEHLRHWVAAIGLKDEPGNYALLPDAAGALAGVAACIAKAPDIWSLAHLPAALPEGTYAIDAAHLPAGGRAKALETMALGWALASYRYDRFKSQKKQKIFPALATPEGVDASALREMTGAIYYLRDLVNTPANHMGPSALAEAAAELAREHRAECRVIAGEELLAGNYPAIHAVGKASADAPRLADLRWGDPSAPKVTLVGKGVCFDTGGLDIKNAQNMLLMKKDMAGAAHVLALARLIMRRNLPIRLRVLIPAVENSVSGNAMRPLDVLETRKGLSVEVGNTDAEGRLILCDALAEADTEAPDLLIDCATLTGAARVALGFEMPAFFTTDDAVAADLARHSVSESDPLWRLPLHEPYQRHLKSEVADITNDPQGSGGSVMAALFLKKFVEKAKAWVHLDMMAWNLKALPGRPVGGEAMGLRALYALLVERYG